MNANHFIDDGRRRDVSRAHDALNTMARLSGTVATSVGNDALTAQQGDVGIGESRLESHLPRAHLLVEMQLVLFLERVKHYRCGARLNGLTDERIGQLDSLPI